MTLRPNLDDQLCFALYAATNMITRAYRPLLDEIGLTYPQYLLLLVLWQDGDCTSGHIAKRLNLAPNAITPLVDRLVTAGFVDRVRDENDRRVVNIGLTGAGRALEQRIAQVQGSVACQTGMSPAEVADLRNELVALVRRMAATQATTGTAA